MVTWREDVQAALVSVGGVGSLEQIYDAVELNKSRDFPSSWKAIVRRELEYNSSDSESYQGRYDLFYSVRGIGAGIWGLRSAESESPRAVDVLQPERILTYVYRVIRDTPMSRRIKQFHGNKCQLCSEVLILSDGTAYSEAHHIQPLGKPHDGPDIPSNIIVVCPNHHALLDYGAISLDMARIRDHQLQGIQLQYIEYHNQRVVPKSKPLHTKINILST